MPNAFEDRELARRAGRKSGKPISKKRKEWEEMGATLVGTWTDYITEYGNKLIENGNFEEFYPLYKDMVNYFKPRLASTQVKQETETKFTLSDEQIIEQIRIIIKRFGTGIDDESDPIG